MDEYDEQTKFLQRQWYCYQMTGWKVPYCAMRHFSLNQFIRCLERFSAHCVVQCQPFACEYLLCSSLWIDLKSETKDKLAANARKLKKANTLKRKKKALTARDKSDSEEDAEDAAPIDDANFNVLDIEDLAKFRNQIAFKLALDPELQHLFSSCPLSACLKACLTKCLGVEAGGGHLSLLGAIKGDPRHMGTFKLQRGTEMDRITSSQATLENELVRGLQERGRLPPTPIDRHPLPLGPVTRVVGALPANYPRLTNVDVVFRQVPGAVNTRIKVDAEESKLQNCKEMLSKLRIQDMSVSISTPSLFHLYHNSSYESVVATTDAAMSDAEILAMVQENKENAQDCDNGRQEGGRRATKKKKLNIEGVVRKAPLFLQQIRSSATLHPVQEYTLPTE